MTSDYTNITSDRAVFGALIQKLRETQEPPMTQVVLSKLMDTKPSTWSRVEKGETELTAMQVRALSKIFSISADRMFELAEQAAEVLKAQGIEVKSYDFLKSQTKSDSTNALSGSALAGLAVAGFIPVFGPALTGIIGAVVLPAIFAYRMNKKTKDED